MAGDIAGVGSTPNYMTQDQFNTQLDSWWKKQQPLPQTQPIGSQAQPANVYQASYGTAPMQQQQPVQQQQFSPLGSWSPFSGGYGMQSPFGMMGQYGGGYGQMGYGQQFGGYGMQSPFGYGQQMYSPYGGMGSGFGMGGMGYGGYGMQTPFSSGYGMGYGGYQQPRPQYGGQQGYGNYGQPRGGFNSTYADPKPVPQFAQQNPWDTGIPRPDVQVRPPFIEGDTFQNDSSRTSQPFGQVWGSLMSKLQGAQPAPSATSTMPGTPGATV